MSAFFVTSTGTDAGKTYVSEKLLCAWRSAGRPVHALKPLMSGYSESSLETSDAGRLLAAMGQPVNGETVSNICLHRHEPPLAPNVIMRQAGVHQDYPAILSFVRHNLAWHAGKTVLIEGAGGVMSPVTDTRLHIDLMTDLGLPAILVTAPYLGAVSHTLSAIRVEIAALVISQLAPDRSPPGSLASEIRLFSDLPIFTVQHGQDCQRLIEHLGH